MRFNLRGCGREHHTGDGGNNDALSHRCCLQEGELKQPKPNEAEPLQPSLRVFTVSQEKKCYSLYGAASELDHLRLTWSAARLMPKPLLTTKTSQTPAQTTSEWAYGLAKR